MRKILTQHYTKEHKKLFNLTSPINQAYAEKNGFEYITSDVRRCIDREIWWEKIAWLIELLNSIEDGTLVVYEDCDSLNVGGDLTNALHDNMIYGMVQLRHGIDCLDPAPWYNAGVIIMINSQDVRNFFNRVWNRNDKTDEMSMNKELKFRNWTIGNSKRICSLDPAWNSWANNSHLCEEIFIKSWHGMKYEDKLLQIKDYIKNTGL